MSATNKKTFYLNMKGLVLKMKKMYLLLMVVALALLLASCSSDTTSTTKAPVNNSANETSTKNNVNSKKLEAHEAQKLLQKWLDNHPFQFEAKIENEYEELTINGNNYYNFGLYVIRDKTYSILVNRKTSEMFYRDSSDNMEQLDKWYQKSTNLPRQESAKKPAGQSKPSSEVTMENFKRIRNGMTYSQVVQIFGKEGKLSISTGSMEVYVWEGDGWMSGNASVTFEKGRCMAKAQSGLE